MKMNGREIDELIYYLKTKDALVSYILSPMPDEAFSIGDWIKFMLTNDKKCHTKYFSVFNESETTIYRITLSFDGNIVEDIIEAGEWNPGFLDYVINGTGVQVGLHNMHQSDAKETQCLEVHNKNIENAVAYLVG